MTTGVVVIGAGSMVTGVAIGTPSIVFRPLLGIGTGVGSICCGIWVGGHPSGKPIPPPMPL